MVSLLMLLLLSALLAGCQQQQHASSDPPKRRTLYSVSPDEVTCSAGYTKPACTDADCFVVEEASPTLDYGTLESQEWSDMSELLQELATRDRLEDAYPSRAQVMLPRSGRKQRVCPVSHELDVSRDRVPMLLVQVRCIHHSCQGTIKCRCIAAQQYRQVYIRQAGCTVVSGAGFGSGGAAAVFVKTFVNVTVNCAAAYQLL